MVRRDVENDADIRLQTVGQVQLIGRELQHIDRSAVHRLQAQHAIADVAANPGIATRFRADVTDQGGGRRFTVGAGDGDHLRSLVVRRCVHRAGEQLHVTQDLDAGGPRLFHRPMRRRVGQRNARREQQRRELRPVGAGKVGERQPLCGRSVTRCRSIIPERHFGPAGDQRARSRQARAGQPEHRNRPALESRNADHRPVRALLSGA